MEKTTQGAKPVPGNKTTLFTHPTGVNARRFSPLNYNVVIRRIVTEAPRDGHFSPPEAVLVDLYVEREALGLMDLSGFQSMAFAMAMAGRLMTAAVWYEAGRISQEIAAAIAGMDRADFLLALSRLGRPSFAVDFNDLDRELALG